MSAVVMAHTVVISRAARAARRRNEFLARHYPEPADADQQAHCYCLRYGTRYYDGLAPLATYFGVLAAHGLWDGVAVAYRRAKAGAPATVYVGRESLEELNGDDQELMRRLLCVDVAAALGVLTPREREAVVLRYGLDGCGPRESPEIGGIMGITPITVRTTLSSALRRLRTNLKVEDWCG